MTDACSTIDAPYHGTQPWIGGLIFAIAFDAQGKGRALPTCDETVLQKAEPGGWLWLHFNLADVRSETFIAKRSGLPSSIVGLLLDEEDRHVLLAEDAAVALVLSDFETEFDQSAGFEPSRLRLAITDRIVISVRRPPLMCVDRVRRAVLAGGRKLISPADVIGALGDVFVDTAADHIETFDDRFDEVEDAVIAGLSDAGGNEVPRMRRTLLRLHREVAPMRSLMRRLSVLSNEEPDSPVKNMTSEAGRLISLLESLDGEVRDLQARARLIREEIEALASTETNRQLFILSVLSALFLPGTLVTGLFGMNTPGLPFNNTSAGFWFALAVAGLATTAVILIIRFVGRRR